MGRLLLTGPCVILLGVAALIGLSGVEAGGGGGCHGPLTDGAATQIEIVAGCYGPTVARVQIGDTVTWVNRDAAMHNVYATAQDWSDGRTIYQDKTVSARFDKTGVFPYVCSMHPGMVGVVVVGDGSGPAAATYVPAAAADLAVNTEVPSSEPVTVPTAVATSDGDGATAAVWAGVAALGSAIGTGAVAVGLVRRRR